MALHQNLGQRATYQDLVRVLVIIVAAIALMAIVSAIVGVQATGPSYQIVPDPAGVSLPF